MQRSPALFATSNARRKTSVFVLLGAVALVGATLAIYDLQRGIKQATSLYSVGVAGLSVEGDLQAYTQQSRRTLIYALTTSDPNEQIPFVTQARAADKRVLQLHVSFRNIDLDPQTRAVLVQLEQNWLLYDSVRDDIVALILEGHPAEALNLEQRDGAAHFEACARSLQSLKEHLDAYAQSQLLRVQQTYYRSAVEVGMLVMMALLFVIVLFKLTELHHKNSQLGEAELCERERNLVLQLVSEDKPLSDVLAAVQILVERQYAGSICAVRLVDGEFLTFGAATRLPASYAIATTRSRIRPPSSTCALAVTTQALAFTSRIDTDPNWSDPNWSGITTDLLRLGVRSCVSVPIRSATRDVLGTVALFLPHQESTSASQATLLERTARLAAIGIEYRLTANQLAFHARHDSLTGLPNRARLMEVLADRISRARDPNWAVIWVDLDRFKPINDSLGHQVGDMLLQAVAARLRDCVSDSDTVARIGGDEFVLVVDTANLDAARAVATRVVHVVGEQFVISSHKLLVTASVGVGRFPEHGTTATELLRNADLAMYGAKQNGKNSFRVFDPKLAEGPSDLHEVEHLVGT